MTHTTEKIFFYLAPKLVVRNLLFFLISVVMCFKNLLSKAFCAFAGAALIVAGCDKAQTPPTTNDDDKPQETVNHFTVTLTDITTTSCIVSIDKDDDDQLFYYAIVRKPSFEEFGNSFQEKAKA